MNQPTLCTETPLKELFEQTNMMEASFQIHRKSADKHLSEIIYEKTVWTQVHGRAELRISEARKNKK